MGFFSRSQPSHPDPTVSVFLYSPTGSLSAEWSLAQAKAARDEFGLQIEVAERAETRNKHLGLETVVEFAAQLSTGASSAGTWRWLRCRVQFPLYWAQRAFDDLDLAIKRVEKQLERERV